MFGILNYIGLIVVVNVGKYARIYQSHGCYGNGCLGYLAQEVVPHRNELGTNAANDWQLAERAPWIPLVILQITYKVGPLPVTNGVILW